MKKINFLFIFVLFLTTSCGDVGKALRNEKTRTTDEFLIKKKEPLVIPPNFEEIPEPDTKITKKENNPQEKIKKMLKTSPNQKTKSTQNSKSLEKSILEKIKK